MRRTNADTANSWRRLLDHDQGGRLTASKAAEIVGISRQGAADWLTRNVECSEVRPGANGGLVRSWLVADIHAAIHAADERGWGGNRSNHPRGTK